MKVIFLDIDGVLNTFKTFEEIYYEYKETGVRRIEIDLKRLEYLKKIVNETGAVIVLSSSWRKFFTNINDKIIPKNESAMQLMKTFEQYELSIYDVTSQDKEGIRQNEIMSWMQNKDVSNFIVIDDDSHDLQIFINKELIKTNFTVTDEMLKNTDDYCGLCEKHIQEAIDILNLENKKLTK